MCKLYLKVNFKKINKGIFTTKCVLELTHSLKINDIE